MSKLGELLKEFCPDGVGTVLLENVWVRGPKSKLGVTKVQKLPKGDNICFTSGSNFFYVNDFLVNGEFLFVNDGGTADFKYNSGKSYYTDHVFAIGANERLSVRFLYHFLNSKKNFINENLFRGSGIKNLSIEKLGKLYIPLPPLPVQEEIVRILDNFTELTAELTARKKQYEYYKKSLLSQPITIFVTKLEEVATLKTGSKPKEIFAEKDKFEYINAGTTNSGYARAFNCEGDTVTTPSRGQGGIGFVGYQKNSFWLGPLCYRIKSKNTDVLLNRYLYHYLSCFNDKILQYKNEGGTPSVNASDLANISIDIPSIDEQKLVIAILDRFDTLCNDLTNGLPAEIEARRKQYEYYRDKLLTFREAKA